MVDSREHRKHADAVGDEVGRVLGADDAFAQRRNEKPLELVEDDGARVLALDQLDEVHVARWIEEMHAAETRPQFRGECFRELVDRESGGIARENGVLGEVRSDLAVEVGFPVHAFGNRFDHEFAVLEQFKMLIVVCGPNAGRARRNRQWAGFELLEVVEGLQHVAVGIAVLGRQFEEDDRNVGVDQMRRDLRPHHTGAEHRGLADYKGRSG